MADMLRAALIFLIITNSMSSMARGIGWCYTIVGTAFDKTSRKPIINELIVVGGDTVRTDAEGRFSAKLCGVTCDRGSWSRGQRRQYDALRYNTIEIKRISSSRTMTTKSKWRKYGIDCVLKHRNDPDCAIWHRDLYLG